MALNDMRTGLLVLFVHVAGADACIAFYEDGVSGLCQQVDADRQHRDPVLM